MTNNWIYPIGLALCSLSLTALADIQRQPIDTIPKGAVQLSERPDNRSRTWTGIGRLRANNTSFCTATLIDNRNKNSASEKTPSYILTSHRCLNTKAHGNYEYPGGIQANQPITGSIYFNNFDNTLGDLKEYSLKRVVWESNEGLNIALIELDAPLATLIADGIYPLKIANRTPPTGTEVITLGIPEFSNLHAVHCTQLSSVDIATHPWVSTQLLKNKCSSLTSGANGGPVVSRADNQLISVLVASSHGALLKNRCLSDAPCELMGSATVWSPDTHYTRPVSFLNQCFKDGVFTTTDPECDLYQLTSVKLEGNKNLPARILEILPTENDVPPDSYTLEFKVDASHFRYKYTHEASSCGSGENYSQALPSTQTSVRWELDKKLGMHLLCIIAVDSTRSRPTNAQFDNAKIIAIERTPAHPIDKPIVQIKSYKNAVEYYATLWFFDPLIVKRYEIKYGPFNETDCSRPEGYYDLPDWETFTRSSGPWDEIYTHKDHPTDPNLILIKRTVEQLDGNSFDKVIRMPRTAIKLCTVLYNAKDIASEPREDILKPL